MDRNKIALLGMEEFEEALSKQGFDVRQTIESAYRLFYEGKRTIALDLEEFKSILASYTEEILRFGPAYFFAAQGFFCGVLGRLDKIRRSDMTDLWINFIRVLNRKGIITVVSSADDPRAFIIGGKDIRRITFAFRLVKTHSMQYAHEYEKRGQKPIFFPGCANRVFDEKGSEKDTRLEDKIRASVFDFDLFFAGMFNHFNPFRKIFYWRLSKKVRDLNYFFGNKDIFYTSRKKINFDLFNGRHVMEIYKRTAVNVIYGSLNDYYFGGSWGVTDRLFNIAYCNGFFICDYRRHLPAIFDIDTKLYTFRSVGECLEKTRFYMKNKNLRDDLANKFHAQVMAKYTIDKAAARLMNDIDAAVRK